MYLQHKLPFVPLPPVHLQGRAHRLPDRRHGRGERGRLVAGNLKHRSGVRKPSVVQHARPEGERQVGKPPPVRVEVRDDGEKHVGTTQVVIVFRGHGQRHAKLRAVRVRDAFGVTCIIYWHIGQQYHEFVFYKKIVG